MISIRTFQKAARLLTNPQEFSRVWGEALEKANQYQKTLRKVWEDFLTLFRLCKSWVLAEYREVPTSSVVWALAAILYFLNPFDLIPDLLPGGFIDDIAAIAWVIKKIRVDIEKFRAWEHSKAEGEEPPPTAGSLPPTNEVP